MTLRARWGWAWFWLGVAVQMKVMVLIVAPFFLLAGGWRKVWVFVLMLVVPSLLFWPHLDGLLEGLLSFGGESAFNGGLFETLRFVGFPEGLARAFCLTIFVGGIGATTLLSFRSASAEPRLRSGEVACGSRKRQDRHCSVALALLVICAPIVHFWYLAWVIPFLALRPQLSWVVLCGTMAVTFLAWENAEAGLGWGYSREIVVASWLPFFLLLAWENRWFLSRTRTDRESLARPTATVDIVVPVYSVGERLKPFLAALCQASPEAGRIIVVDGHPDAADFQLAREAGVEAIASERGRGIQIATGIARTTSDLVAIVHADTVPMAGWIPRVQEAAQREPRASAFALGQRFDRSGIGLLGIEMLNEARVVFSGSVFGDQTLVVRRNVLEEAGGFPSQPLMEDVEVSWRLLARGPIVYLGEEWEVSSGKWQRGFVLRFWLVVSLMIRYRLVRLRGRKAAAEFSKKLYREYYRES
jgi:GT2 family glycosyltransferase